MPSYEADIPCSSSFVEPRPKVITMMIVMIITIIMNYECKWRTVCWNKWEKGEEKTLRGEEGGSTLKIYM
jgi:hypothetical protein